MAGAAEGEAPTVATGAAAIAMLRAARGGGAIVGAMIDLRGEAAALHQDLPARLAAADPVLALVVLIDRPDAAMATIAAMPEAAERLTLLTEPLTAEALARVLAALIERARSARRLVATQAALRDERAARSAERAAAERLATRDPLTGAPNRLAFLSALDRAAAGTQRFALAMLDLDRFKLVNDTLGHLAGDAMLRETHALLVATVPETCLTARLAGDEFELLLPVVSEDEAVMRVEQVIKACAAPMRVLGHAVPGGISAGLVVVDPATGEDPIDLLRRADLALNDAKRCGRGCARLYDAAMDARLRHRRELEGALAGAIARGELDLVFQPIVDQRDLIVEGFEALIRWQSPDFGMVPPALFIPIAEESNLIHMLGDWVIDRAVAALRDWPTQYLSVNFSPRQFRRPNFVAHVIARVAQAGVAPQRFQIEITETAIFDDGDRAAETLYRLRQMGFRVALDDFGTGYSSLSNIRRFALDCLKIDRTFVEGLGRDRESPAIVQVVIQLARALGMSVVAEGVETRVQLEALRAAGCSHLQGYYIARPLDAAGAAALAVAGQLAEAALPGLSAARAKR